MSSAVLSESVVAWSSLSDWRETRGTEPLYFKLHVSLPSPVRSRQIHYTVSSLPRFWPSTDSDKHVKDAEGVCPPFLRVSNIPA